VLNESFTPGGLKMAGYRLYFMDRFSGHIEQRRDFFADDEAKAVTIAEEWNNGQPMELWEGAHKLKRWDSEPTGPRLAASEMVRAEREQQDDR
jgi:hypothetical protein